MNSDQTVEFETPKMVIAEKKLILCSHCQIRTPHWPIMNGHYMCGFCGTENAV